MLRNEVKYVIFLIGGCDRLGIPVNTIHMYFPERDFWFPLKPMSVKRASPICAILNENYILALGGVGNDPPQAPSNAIELYDIKANTWHTMPAMTKPLMGMAHLIKNNNLLIFGGMSIDTNPTDDARILSLNVDQSKSESGFQLVWRPLPKMPSSRYAAQCLDFGEKIAVVGGRVGKSPVSKFEVYDKNTATWETYPDYPGQTVFNQIIKLKNRIFVIGGLNTPAERGFSSEAHYYNMDSGPAGEWQPAPKLKFKRGDFAVLPILNQESQSSNLSTIDEVQALTSMSISRGSATANASASASPQNVKLPEILVVGGLGSSNSEDLKNGKPLGICESLQVNDASGPKRSWTSVQGLENGRGSAAFVECDGFFYLIGGIQFTEGTDPKDTEKNGPTGRVDRLLL